MDTRLSSMSREEIMDIIHSEKTTDMQLRQVAYFLLRMVRPAEADFARSVFGVRRPSAGADTTLRTEERGRVEELRLGGGATTVG